MIQYLVWVLALCRRRQLLADEVLELVLHLVEDLERIGELAGTLCVGGEGRAEVGRARSEVVGRRVG